MQTYIIYIGLLISIWLLAKIADKKNKKAFLILAIIILSFVAGFRAYSVGIDTINYDNKFSLIANGDLEYAYGLEEGFKYLCLVLLKICNSSTFLFVIFATITNACVLLRMWDFRHMSSLGCMVVCYYIGFYFMTMNVMRQFCAIAILFYFTRLLSQGKYFKYCAVIAITTLCFHQSALIGLAFLVLEIFNWKTLSRKQKRILIFGLFLIPFASVIVFSTFEEYQHYFSSMDLDVGFMLPLKIIFFMVTVILSGAKNKFKNNNNETLSVSLYYLLGLLITCLGYAFTFMDRIGWYFYIFEGVYMGIVLRNASKSNKIFYSFCLLFLMGYSFVNILMNGSQGVIPYSFIWN
ncbi:MAG: EpsG family protein [Clostridia bacterium]|nr:EpsG family protein [Clostridia bacterium]